MTPINSPNKNVVEIKTHPREDRRQACLDKSANGQGEGETQEEFVLLRAGRKSAHHTIVPVLNPPAGSCDYSVGLDVEEFHVLAEAGLGVGLEA